MYPLIEILEYFPKLSELNRTYIEILTTNYPDRYYFKPIERNSYIILDKTYNNAPRHKIFLSFFEYVN
jgi:hypothetical protein